MVCVTGLVMMKKIIEYSQNKYGCISTSNIHKNTVFVE